MTPRIYEIFELEIPGLPTPVLFKIKLIYFLAFLLILPLWKTEN